jgi:hypothetical protein
MDNDALASPPLADRTSRAPLAQVWSGRALTGVIVTFLLVDAAAKLVLLAPVVESMQKLGFAAGLRSPQLRTLVLSPHSSR